MTQEEKEKDNRQAVKFVTFILLILVHCLLICIAGFILTLPSHSIEHALTELESTVEYLEHRLSEQEESLQEIMLLTENLTHTVKSYYSKPGLLYQIIVILFTIYHNILQYLLYRIIVILFTTPRYSVFMY